MELKIGPKFNLQGYLPQFIYKFYHLQPINFCFFFSCKGSLT